MGGIPVIAALIVCMVLIYQQYLLYCCSKSKKTLDYILKNEFSERRDISSFLHDKILNDLTAIRIYVSISQQKDIPEIQKYENSLKQCIENAIENAHSAQYKLTPPLLYSNGLASALLFYCNNKWPDSDINFTVRQGSHINIPQWLAYSFYRNMQDFLTVIINNIDIKNCNLKIYKSTSYVIAELSISGLKVENEINNLLIHEPAYKEAVTNLKMLGGKLLEPKNNNNSFLIKYKANVKNRNCR